ncbi:hypothetical protein QO230_00645 [Vibrio vulnificus]|uniref:hypothetical protein n=1 Tax=Vibrio vulnificus TaxID=672 RepID=UPI0024DF9156|nr:hypothetical protein [Vibrio vulnificus]MDK2606123.1 hypothetical protein [Vibrio vulnificus]MDK2609867.1 hypothetical protein [Vibrio vulnificus]MDK2627365.1 hypothetical protein [Vibrio vulnificus]MDK2702810.1 hypothetical protein [Vibrio vulnificus]
MIHTTNIYTSEKERNAWRRFAINNEIPQSPQSTHEHLLRKLFLKLYRSDTQLAKEVTYI